MQPCGGGSGLTATRPTILYSGFVPELPDIVVYIEALEKRILGETLDEIRIASPFLLRTAMLLTHM